MSGASADELVELVLGAGFALSRAQLARLHRRGLIPSPVQRSLGRGRGTKSVYPEGTGEQLLRLCELRVTRRNLDDVGWLLWWEEFDVRPDVVRRVVDRVVTGWAEAWRSLVDDGGGLTEDAMLLLDEAHELRLPSRSLRWMRRRAGTDDFPVVLEALLCGVVGGGVPPHMEDEVVHALGLDLAQTDALPATRPWLDGDPLEGLRAAGALLNPVALSGLAGIMSAEELRLATRRARGLLEVFHLIASAISRPLGRWALGFGMPSAIALDSDGDVAGQVLITLYLHGLDAEGFVDGIEELLGAAPGLREAAALVDILDDVAAEIPGASKLVSLRQLGRSMRDVDERARFTAAITELSDAYSDEVRAIAARHDPCLRTPD